MGAPKGNQFWKLALRHGPYPKYKDAESLLKACSEYLAWVDAHPLYETRLAQSKGEPVKVKLPKMRAMTIVALCLFIGITHETWTQYRKKKGLSEVTEIIDGIIYSQKFEGASADLLNANIIARDLGLKDNVKTENDTNITIKIDRKVRNAD